MYHGQDVWIVMQQHNLSLPMQTFKTLHGRNAGHGWCCVGPCLQSGRGVQVGERRGFHLLNYVTPLNPAPSGQPGQSGNVHCWGVEPPSDILARDLEVRARGSPTRCCPGPGPRGQGAHLQQHKPIQKIFKSTARIQRRPCAVFLSTNQLANITVEDG